MNQKNSLGLNICFKDEDNPMVLFEDWYNEAIKSEINDPNAVAVGTVSREGYPTVRMVLLKNYNNNGFIFYTNLNSPKSNNLKNNPKASMCFHWKSLQRQIIISGSVTQVNDKEADDYFKSRPYESKIGAWASNQSQAMNKREDFLKKIDEFKKKFKDKDNVPRPKHWSGWNLTPDEIEFWLDGENRIHERLKYTRDQTGSWNKSLLSP